MPLNAAAEEAPLPGSYNAYLAETGETSNPVAVAGYTRWLIETFLPERQLEAPANPVGGVEAALGATSVGTTTEIEGERP